MLNLKIVSGGQTGVDRAALDVALEKGLPAGGWCPRGRRAEDGPIPLGYPLRETESADYTERTERNVRDSDGTLIVTRGRPTGGTAYTIAMAEKWHKPVHVADLAADAAIEPARQWLATQCVKTLNVAGPRESTTPGIHAEAHAWLSALIGEGGRVP